MKGVLSFPTYQIFNMIKYSDLYFFIDWTKYFVIYTIYSQGSQV